jgi:Fis family transcriptional regulator
MHMTPPNLSTLASSVSLRECVRHALRNYLRFHGDSTLRDLHTLVVSEIERNLIKEVLDFTKGNQSQASVMLGLSRTTLRQRLAFYRINQRPTSQTIIFD